MYQITFRKDAAKSYRKIFQSNRKLFFQINNQIEKLQTNPFIGKPLLGKLKGCYSIRVRDYRIVYEIRKKRLIIYILAIAHRQFDYKL